MSEMLEDVGRSGPLLLRPSGPVASSRKVPVWLLAGLAAILVVVGVVRLVSALSAGLASAPSYQTHVVQRGPLRITVTEDGNVESARNVDIKCQVLGGSTILWIIPEGTDVTQGTELVRLDASAIEEQLTQQRIAYEKALSAYATAQKDVEIADTSIREYEDGTFRQELQLADANVVIGQENLKSAQNVLEHSQKMFRKGYINQLQLEADHFAVKRAELELEAQNTARKVLVDFTKAKRKTELKSTHEAAQAKLRAEKEAVDLEKTKLDRLEKQTERCVLVAPQEGMVVYASQRSSRMSTPQVIIEEGAIVRESQTVIQLPDLSQMQVKVLVHETKVDKIKPGMPADVKIRNWKTGGKVSSVNSQPEPGSWFSSSVKEYAAFVKIDGNTSAVGIKPGMTAEVEILVEELPAVLSVPVLGVIEQGEGKYYCYVKRDGGYEKRPAVIGKSNDRYIEIQDGLNEGDEVILNPRSTIPEARQREAAEAAPAKASESSGGPAPGGQPAIRKEAKASPHPVNQEKGPK